MKLEPTANPRIGEKIEEYYFKMPFDLPNCHDKTLSVTISKGYQFALELTATPVNIQVDGDNNVTVQQTTIYGGGAPIARRECTRITAKQFNEFRDACLANLYNLVTKSHLQTTLKRQMAFEPHGLRLGDIKEL